MTPFFGEMTDSAFGRVFCCVLTKRVDADSLVHRSVWGPEVERGEQNG